MINNTLLVIAGFHTPFLVGGGGERSPLVYRLCRVCVGGGNNVHSGGGGGGGTLLEGETSRVSLLLYETLDSITCIHIHCICT